MDIVAGLAIVAFVVLIAVVVSKKRGGKGKPSGSGRDVEKQSKRGSKTK